MIKKMKFLIAEVIPTLFKLLFAIVLKWFGYKKIYSNCWIVSERGDDARDNGFFFFKYLCDNHPEIECFYLITTDSADYSKVCSCGNVIEYGSISHYVAVLQAKCLLSSHIMGFTPNVEVFTILQKKNVFDFKGKKIFLQHGIIKDDIEGLKYPNVKVDMFVSGAYEEYLVLCNTYRHPQGTIRLTGLARYDGLNSNKTKKQILIMPTWRMWLRNKSDTEFMESSYYKAFADFLNSDELRDWLLAIGYQVLFYLHYEFQEYSHLFKTAECDSIRICEFNRYEVQTLLKDCELLITDYSSVFFDVAYQRKPIIYLQFDQNEFRGGHYNKGYFDETSFGYVVQTSDQLLNVLKFIYRGTSFRNDFEENQNHFFRNLNGSCCDNIYRNLVEIIYE